jgi:hypothetical protein
MQERFAKHGENGIALPEMYLIGIPQKRPRLYLNSDCLLFELK